LLKRFSLFAGKGEQSITTSNKELLCHEATADGVLQVITVLAATGQALLADLQEEDAEMRLPVDLAEGRGRVPVLPLAALEKVNNFDGP